MALFTAAVLMMAVDSDVSMATGSGNCASNRQVRKANVMYRNLDVNTSITTLDFSQMT